MERMGFMRHGRSVAIAATFSVAAAVVGLMAPVAAAEETTPGTWTMPDLKEELLQHAIDDVSETAGSDNVRFKFVNDQVVYNYTNWVVCAQSPEAETSVKIGAKPQTVAFRVERPSIGC